MDLSFQVLRKSSSPSRRCSVTDGAALGAREGLDLELAGAGAGPAHALLGRHAGAARLHGDAIGDDEGRVEADAELADELGVLALLALQAGDELARSALGDGAQVLHRLGEAHADAVVGNGEGAGLGVERDAHLEVRRVLPQRGLVERLEAQLVAGVGGVGDQLAEEDLLVGIERVGDEVQDLLDLGLEREGLLFHDVRGRCKDGAARRCGARSWIFKGAAPLRGR